MLWIEAVNVVKNVTYMAVEYATIESISLYKRYVPNIPPGPKPQNETTNAPKYEIII